MNDTGMNNTDFFLLGDVARLLRCQPHRIVYLLTTRQVPEPALRIGNKRVFTAPDIQRVAERLQAQPARGVAASERGGDGR
jgi:DNA-binding transcriptional MerR regulator